MANTELLLVTSWTDEGDPDEWPPPDEVSLWEVIGGLRDAVLKRLGVPNTGEESVNLEERTTTTGYSEYTAWEELNFVIYVNDVRVFSWEDDEYGNPEYGNPINALIKWLDEE
jgi:hypothetical protein